MFTNLANFANPANRSLVLGVVFRPVKVTYLVRSAAVNRSKASSADLKFCELVKLNLNTVTGIPLALRLGLPSLQVNSVLVLLCIHE